MTSYERPTIVVDPGINGPGVSPPSKEDSEMPVAGGKPTHLGATAGDAYSPESSLRYGGLVYSEPVEGAHGGDAETAPVSVGAPDATQAGGDHGKWTRARQAGAAAAAAAKPVLKRGAEFIGDAASRAHSSASKHWASRGAAPTGSSEAATAPAPEATALTLWDPDSGIPPTREQAFAISDQVDELRQTKPAAYHYATAEIPNSEVDGDNAPIWEIDENSAGLHLEDLARQWQAAPDDTAREAIVDKAVEDLKKDGFLVDETLEKIARHKGVGLDEEHRIFREKLSSDIEFAATLGPKAREKLIVDTEETQLLLFLEAAAQEELNATHPLPQSGGQGRWQRFRGAAADAARTPFVKLHSAQGEKTRKALKYSGLGLLALSAYRGAGGLIDDGADISGIIPAAGILDVGFVDSPSNWWENAADLSDWLPDFHEEPKTEPVANVHADGVGESVGNQGFKSADTIPSPDANASDSPYQGIPRTGDVTPDADSPYQGIPRTGDVAPDAPADPGAGNQDIPKGEVPDAGEKPEPGTDTEATPANEQINDAQAKIIEGILVDDPDKIKNVPGFENFDPEAATKQAAAEFNGKGNTLWDKLQDTQKLNDPETWKVIVGNGPNNGGLEELQANGFDINMGGDATMTKDGIKFDGDNWWIDSVKTPEGGTYVTMPNGETFFYDGALNQNEQAALFDQLSHGGKVLTPEQMAEQVAAQIPDTQEALNQMTEGIVQDVTQEVATEVNKVEADATATDANVNAEAVLEQKQEVIETYANDHAHLIAELSETQRTALIGQIAEATKLPIELVRSLVEKSVSDIATQ